MLTEIRCRNAKPGERATKLYDERGLFLFVTPAGFKSWRMKYRFAEREKQLAFGGYPEVSLREARDRRDEARKLLRDGIDPGVARKQRKAERHTSARNTFEVAARRWHDSRKASWAPRYAGQVLARFENDVFPAIGALPITAVTVPLMLGVLQAIERRGSIEIAHRVRQHASDIFQTAIAAGIATTDPAGGLRKALGTVVNGRRPAVRSVARATVVLQKVEAHNSYATLRLASRLLALTAARPGALRLAAPDEFEDLDGPAPLWRIPSSKMKLTAERKRDLDFEFVLPLSTQAVEVVRIAKQLSAGLPHLFPAASNARQPFSDSTLSKLYREAGFRGVHVPHGWRATFSTVMNERAAMENRVGDRAIIDLMLAHIPEGVEPIYNRYGYMPRRRELAQEWADLVTAGLAPPESLLEGAWGTSARNRRRGRERARIDAA